MSFKYKDYRLDGPERFKVMTLATGEFIRRFLIHVLPKGFHRIRHYGLLANGNRTENVTKAKELLASHAASSEPGPDADEDEAPPPQQRPCPCCGGRMRIIEVFTPGQAPRHRATPILTRIDTS